VDSLNRPRPEDDATAVAGTAVVPAVEPATHPRYAVPADTRTLRILVGAASLAVVVGALHAADNIVAPLMLALALTILVHPLRRRLGRHLPSWAASAGLLLGAYAVLVVLGLMLLVSLAQLADLVPQYQKQLEAQFSAVGDTLQSWGVTSAQVDQMKGSLSTSTIVDAVSGLLGSLAGVLSNVFFIVTLLLFLAFDGAQTERLMGHLRGVRPDLAGALSWFAHGTRSYLGVSAAFGLIVAVIDTVALAVMGVPGAFVWGVLAFVTNFIPNIGFVIGVVPPALIALLSGGPGLMVAVIVVYSVVNFVIQSIIQPRIVGGAVGLSTSLTFLSLVFWTWILGPLGALLAVPMSLLARALLIDAHPRNAWMTPFVIGRPVEVEAPGEPPGPVAPTAATTSSSAHDAVGGVRDEHSMS
jgi:predicted PurR-regulated permease PerM